MVAQVTPSTRQCRRVKLITSRERLLRSCDSDHDHLRKPRHAARHFERLTKANAETKTVSAIRLQAASKTTKAANKPSLRRSTSEPKIGLKLFTIHITGSARSILCRVQEAWTAPKILFLLVLSSWSMEDNLMLESGPRLGSQLDQPIQITSSRGPLPEPSD